MWTAKAQIKGEGYLAKLAVKHNISLSGYPVSAYPAGKVLHAVIAGIIIGDEKNKKAFLKDLRKERSVLFQEENKGFITLVLEESLGASVLYNPYIIFTKPILLSSEGNYTTEFASWKQNKIKKLLESIQSQQGSKILKFRKQKISNISIISVLPELTEKQKRVFDSAVKNGYYDFPRKTDLRKLAKQENLSLSTVREHLRLAEKKIIPRNNQA